MPRGRVPAAAFSTGTSSGGDGGCRTSGSCVGAGGAGEGGGVVVASWTPTAVGSAVGEADVEDAGKGAGSGTADEACGGSIVDDVASAVVEGTVTGEVRIVEVAVE